MLLTKEELKQAREWIADCQWADDIDDLTDAEVEAGIHRHYSGGVEQFKKDGNFK